MKTLQESIIGRKGIPRSLTDGYTISIPRIKTLKYEKTNGSWSYDDKCIGWYLMMDHEKSTIMLWSQKATYYPFIYTRDIIFDGFMGNWNLMPGKPNISIDEIYDILDSDAETWNDLVCDSIVNIEINLPSGIESLIKDFYKNTK